jgi:hypothetical protein
MRPLFLERCFTKCHTEWEDRIMRQHYALLPVSLRAAALTALLALAATTRECRE